MRIVICNQIEEENIELEKLIREYLPDESSCEIDMLESGEKMLFEMSDEPGEVDLILSDTDFGGKMDGMDALKQLREIGYDGEIIFISEEKERVFESFAVRPANFLVKGDVTKDKTVNAILSALDAAGKRKREMITFACAGEVKNIALDDILYFEVTNRIVEVHFGEEIFEFYSTMKKLENQLYGKGFIRLHRAYLVNEKHIRSMKGQEAVLDNGEAVPINRKYLKEEKKEEKKLEKKHEDR
ncbi:MAG: response regulator transcription factor [Firmicutes bacterium]|nr:response regulator transcription factor [Bacillota bacterium]